MRHSRDPHPARLRFAPAGDPPQRKSGLPDLRI